MCSLKLSYFLFLLIYLLSLAFAFKVPASNRSLQAFDHIRLLVTHWCLYVQMSPNLQVGLAYVLDTALLEWISEYAVPAYTTPDSIVSYLNHAHATPSCAL